MLNVSFHQPCFGLSQPLVRYPMKFVGAKIRLNILNIKFVILLLLYKMNILAFALFSPSKTVKTMRVPRNQKRQKKNEKTKKSNLRKKASLITQTRPFHQ